MALSYQLSMLRRAWLTSFPAASIKVSRAVPSFESGGMRPSVMIALLNPSSGLAGGEVMAEVFTSVTAPAAPEGVVAFPGAAMSNSARAKLREGMYVGSFGEPVISHCQKRLNNDCIRYSTVSR